MKHLIYSQIYQSLNIFFSYFDFEKGIGLWDENQYFQYKENILFTNQKDYTHENYYYQIYFDRLIII